MVSLSCVSAKGEEGARHAGGGQGGDLQESEKTVWLLSGTSDIVTFGSVFIS